MVVAMFSSGSKVLEFPSPAVNFLYLFFLHPAFFSGCEFEQTR